MAFKLNLISTLCAGALSLLTMPSHAAMVSTFTFQSETIDCFSEISSDCTDIFTNGLSGAFTADLSVLDASGSGSIVWNELLNFNATNSVSTWSLANLTAGGVSFNNWMVADFGINAEPDYSNGWNEGDRGGENMTIIGFGISGSVPAFSGASSLPGMYCLETGGWYPEALSCPSETEDVWTYGISAEYSKPEISAIPIPAAV